MTGAGAPGAAGIIKYLLTDPSIHLTVVDADENAIGKHLTTDFVQVPLAQDETFTKALLNIAVQKKIDLIIPLVSKELFPLSKNKKDFEEKGIRVLVSSQEVIDIANNKSKAYRYLLNKNIDVPQFRVVNTIDEFEKAARELNYPAKNICFKPSVANGSRGFRIISNKTNEFDLLFNQKPSTTYISYANALRILSSRQFPELLVSEYLPGDEYSVDCLAREGKAKLIVPRIRKKMINGISVQGELVENKKIIDYCERIIEAIGLHGNIGIQVKYSDNHIPLLLEINPRMQGTTVSALGAGINFLWLAIKQEMNLPIAPEELNVKWGTKFSRYWTEVFY